MVGALAAGALQFGKAQAADNVPLIGAGYAGGANVVAIPIDDPAAKAIAGALFKPAGAGPFPVVVYMPQSLGLTSPKESPMQKLEMALEKNVIDHLTAKGVATFIVDPFTARSEPAGVSGQIGLSRENFAKYASRGAADVLAAVNVIKATPDVDANRVFLQGYDYGAGATLYAVDASAPVKRDPNMKIAGVIAYYPFCYDKMDPTVPTLVMIGDKDDWASAEACQTAAKDKPNVEVVVYPDKKHGFAMPGAVGRYGWLYDENAAADSTQRADAFMAAHMK
jgi:dienelactone hydrolase